MPKIFLYAEILTHLRQLTLYASLQTEKKEGTKIDISSDKKLITVVHDGESSSLYLPTQISGTARVTFPLDRKTEISARVQIDDIEKWKEQDLTGIEAPWAAVDLSPETSIRCRECKAQLLAQGVVNLWKDLPSGNWAELMDFWFCHKPHEEDDQKGEKAAEAKGFAAKSKLAVSRATGMTDLVSIALHPDDCENVKTAEIDQDHQSVAVRCDKCSAIIGSTSKAESLIRLNKACLEVQPTADSESSVFSPSTFICAQMLSLTESTSIRRIVVHSNRPPFNANRTSDPVNPGILCWIFNPDIYYSSSNHPSSISTPELPTSIVRRAAKIFYEPLPSPLEHLDKNQNTVEELVLSSQAEVDDLNDTLKASNAILPQSARTFQDWEVGLLDRYERNASAMGVMNQNPLAKKVTGQTTRWELPEGYQELYA